MDIAVLLTESGGVVSATGMSFSDPMFLVMWANAPSGLAAVPQATDILKGL